jgi:seryl-tRNA(Sec) selenium transferase
MPSLPKIIKRQSGCNRRELFRRGGFLTSAAFATVANPQSRATSKAVASTGTLYESIGVRPLINARGTFTIITGSQTLPKVKQAMDSASRSYVQMDELMDGVGKRLAELTGAPWGIVTAGCAAALTNCTAGSVAGTNPERMQRLPDLTGLKSEVIIPGYSRNVYDHAVRMIGVKIVEVSEASELEGAFNDRTAMVYILAGPDDDGPLGTEAISNVARRHNVPVLVDAAAEVLTIPNVHLKRGATAVAYSGGKCLRGPQAAGMVLGDKNFLQAAWANSAPHHAFGRSLKAGKEEIMGMLAAVECWKTRDHDAEWRQWMAELQTISTAVQKVSGVTTRVHDPEGLSNHTPELRIEWDATRIGITGQELSKLLFDTNPRIALAGGSGQRPDKMASAVSVVPYMMMPGDAEIVAARLYTALSQPPKFENPPAPTGEPAPVAGQWNLEIRFVRGSAMHTLILEQHGSELLGTHLGEFVSGDLTGKVQSDRVRFHGLQRIQGQTLSYDFKGTVTGDKMSGQVNLGEYGEAEWSAERHQYRATVQRS